MKDAEWLSEQARTKVREGIVAVESASSAEIVATVCVRSGHYRHADYLLGSLLALLALLFYMLYPEPLFDDVALLIIIASFGVGAVLSASVSGMQRLLVSRKRMNEEVRKAARAKFVDQGIGNTRERTGILVYVSLFERRIEVVADSGIPVERLGKRWDDAVARLDASGHKGVDAFVAGLRAMGSLLAEAVPRSANDVNELSDDVVQA